METPKARHLPKGLLEAFNQQRVAIFIGAGASIASGMPTWSELVGYLAGDLGIEPDGTTPGALSPRTLAAIPQYYENARGRKELTEGIRKYIPNNPRRRSLIHDLLATLPCKLYYTTNFDQLLERSISSSGREFDVIATEDDARDHTRQDKCQVRKIHGTRETAHSLIVTRSDFANFATLHPLLTEQLFLDLTTTTFLFVGYGLGDPDFNSVYDQAFFRLSPMNRRHYMTVRSVDEHEKADLALRGMDTIDLTDWADQRENDDDNLGNFLSDLCEATSDSLHIARFFCGLDRDATIPIVVPSLVHEVEPFLFYPAMDLNVAHVVEDSLSVIGVSAVVHSDKKVMAKGDDFLAQDIVLIGSPRGNVVTEYVFQRAASDLASGQASPITSQFEAGTVRALKDLVRGISVEAKDPSTCEKGGDHHEYALIARYKNPWALDKHVFVLAGLWGMGTSAIRDFLNDSQNFRKLPYGGESAVAVLHIRFTEFDPDYSAYDFDLMPHEGQLPVAAH